MHSPRAPSLGHGGGSAGHSWEVLGQQGLNVQGANLVPTEVPGAHGGPGRDALLGGELSVCSLPATRVPAVPRAGARCTPWPPEPARLRGGSASPRRGPATSVYSDFSSWKEKQGPLFQHN